MLERKIEDLQQENESLHAGDVQQKYDYLQQKYDNLQQIFLTQTKKFSKLEGEHADRCDLCCLEGVCVCFRFVIVWRSLSEPHIDHDKDPMHGEKCVCIYHSPTFVPYTHVPENRIVYSFIYSAHSENSPTTGTSLTSNLQQRSTLVQQLAWETPEQ